VPIDPSAHLQPFRSRPVPELAWTVDEPALFSRIADLGVAGVATNDPARLRAPH
jgi:glycerophosphoryl diester phosphodiesterase